MLLLRPVVKHRASSSQRHTLCVQYVHVCVGGGDESSRRTRDRITGRLNSSACVAVFVYIPGGIRAVQSAAIRPVRMNLNDSYGSVGVWL